MNHRILRSADVTQGYLHFGADELQEPAKRIEQAILEHAGLVENNKLVRKQWPNAKIILAADNDWHEQGERDKNGKLKKNVGKIAAEKAALSVGGYLYHRLKKKPIGMIIASVTALRQQSKR
ncbi:DNA primase [Xenorhabdus szentirmaii]|nr:DNA primase [Xenorhabdus szentirmaii DSM 16338]PHM43716.1 DNA primase [Xenorhabdus szentirmaii]